MRIVADANIPLVEEAFGPLGDVVARPADEITPALVRDADALLVRSVTRVGPELLDGSAVRFVATATIGTDHVDQAHLASRGIGFASAAGSNARSVAEWVFAALAVLAERGGWRFADRTLGVVGVGNIGTRVARMAEALGMAVLRNDPPLARATGDPAYVSLDAVAEVADIVTFHVPLERGGPDPTYHLCDGALLARLRPGVVVLNASRGAVVDNRALREAIDAGRTGAAVLDVWEGEPEIDVDLLARADLATPHVAGYSYDGKVNGTRQILAACCERFGVDRPWDPSPRLPPPAQRLVQLPEEASVEGAVRAAIRACYDIEADDRELRRLADQPPEARAAWFKGLRRRYPVRREFPETTIRLAAPDPGVEAALRALGFPVETDGKD